MSWWGSLEVKYFFGNFGAGCFFSLAPLEKGNPENCHQKMGALITPLKIKTEPTNHPYRKEMIFQKPP